MKTGKVKFFNEAKGYGFIIDDETGKEVFVHISEVTGKITENDIVTYEPKVGKKGPNAVNVKKIGELQESKISEKFAYSK